MFNNQYIDRTDRIDHLKRSVRSLPPKSSYTNKDLFPYWEEMLINSEKLSYSSMTQDVRLALDELEKEGTLHYLTRSRRGRPARWQYTPGGNVSDGFPRADQLVEPLSTNRVSRTFLIQMTTCDPELSAEVIEDEIYGLMIADRVRAAELR